jgi:hypothetical protein
MKALASKTARALGCAVFLAVAVPALSQPPEGGAPGTAEAAAQENLAGWWVSYVNEDWRWRMVTAPKDDLSSVPLNDAGVRAADTWDWKKDQAAGLQCKAYGAAAIMRMPTRLHITWEDANSLSVQTDTGMQSRRLQFGGKAYVPNSPRTLQGVSVARWEPTAVAASGLAITSIPPAPPSYSMQVVTTGMQAGYLRTNGVPYSENAVLTEYYDTFTYKHQNWLLVTSIVDDPQYLLQPFITTTQFKREADGSRWHPRPCEIIAPTRLYRPVPPSGYLPPGTH